MSQTLKTLIAKEGRVLGNTQTGMDWCVKALHPSDPLTEVRGIPDRSAIPTLCMNYQTTSTLTVIPGQDTPWAFDMTLLPHPTHFAYWDGVKAFDPALARTTEGNFTNVQLGPPGTSVETLTNAWLALARRWRLCYQSVTVIQDGPDLANQGTIAVSQSTFEPRLTNLAEVVSPAVFTWYPLAYFDRTKEGPSFERSQAMPNSMVIRSRDGAYVPLKLTDTCQQWQSEKDCFVPMDVGTPQTGNSTGKVQLPVTASPPGYPFADVVPAYVAGTSGVRGQRVCSFMNGNVAHISARNLSKETSFTFHFRMGIEIQLDPSSTLVPQLKLSPPYDPVALDAYFSVARELKDAYPADYNDLGKLWDPIKSALATLMPPLLTMIPGGAPLAPLVGPTLEGLTSVGAAVRARRRGRKTRSQPARNTKLWDVAPESLVASQMRKAAESELARKYNVELSQARIERARAVRAASTQNRGGKGRPTRALRVTRVPASS